MPQGKVSPSNIYSVDGLVRIIKQKVVFAKVYEQTFSTEIFQVVKILPRVPQPVYELSDLQNLRIQGQFYNYELVKVTLTPQTEFQIDKIVRTRNKNGIKQHLVKWKGYMTFISGVNAREIKKIWIFTLHCHQTAPVFITRLIQ
jgi:hypothetical protein